MAFVWAFWEIVTSRK